METKTTADSDKITKEIFRSFQIGVWKIVSAFYLNSEC